jgi:hypothetical protein
MSKAYKKDGKFYLEPDPVLTARSTGKADREKTKNKLTDQDLSEILDRVLIRLDALEAKLIDHSTITTVR